MIAKLYKTLLILYASIMIVSYKCNGEESLEEIDIGLEEVEVTLTTKSAVSNAEIVKTTSTIKPDVELSDEITETSTPLPNEIEHAIQKIEVVSLAAQKMLKGGLVPLEENEEFYKNFIHDIHDITTLIKKSDNVYKFIKANGVVRILSNNLMNTHVKLRTQLLLLLKELFVLAPTSTGALLPLNILDRLLDIFEKENNLALKAHALDIMFKWLPNNPNVQARVMKTKGLETFYNQLDKLDIGVIHTLMDLFNKILKEHLDVRNNKAQIASDDGEELVIYQRIGLLERMSTSNVCNGMLNIFEMLWSYNNNDNDNIKTVFELMTNVKPFCSKIFQKKTKAVDFLKMLLELGKNEDKKAYFEEHEVNVTEFVMVIEGYLDMEKESVVKDEF